MQRDVVSDEGQGLIKAIIADHLAVTALHGDLPHAQIHHSQQQAVPESFMDGVLIPESEALINSQASTVKHRQSSV